MSNETCPHCGDEVEGGKWHRRCFIVVAGALIIKNGSGRIDENAVNI